MPCAQESVEYGMADWQQCKTNIFRRHIFVTIWQRIALNCQSVACVCAPITSNHIENYLLEFPIEFR